jgi:hypothetical protein
LNLENQMNQLYLMLLNLLTYQQPLLNLLYLKNLNYLKRLNYLKFQRLLLYQKYQLNPLNH